MKKLLELGKVNNTHGLNGEVKFEPWCDGIEFIKKLKKIYLNSNGESALTLLSARPQKNIVILKFEEISSIEHAQSLKGKVLYCNRDDADLPNGSYYYYADIIGCTVLDFDSKEKYGTVCDVVNYGSCDIFDTKMTDGSFVMIPSIPDIVRSIDTENKKIFITPMRGLFDES